VRVAVDPVASTCEPIEQSVYFVDSGRKLDLLLTLLRGGEVDRALVFTRTKRGANRLAGQLEDARVAVAAIHGNKSQPARERALEGFKRGRTRVVVATDIAARGIDVKGLSHVINFDLPQDPESYVHRVGRTGRAGATGVALTLCSAGERPLLLAIERLTRRRLERRETPTGLAAEPRRREAVPSARQRPRRSAEGRSQRGRRW
jgi:ATP-dependent RNA helicase RhlE